ncbi:hypothetical protein Lal_00027435 [Lupinus albus]|uniref:Uncharacterized protein n=1 Tax=Lupinus albus TaxID=3870 RepID=A0A6A5MJJ4_LUPAL|nr:hypothetical protein Lalb_Chr05g0213881 [Lupinus albus]KAF1873397.1 hypothetical protein Lal_00027435 [Lupinus albus]
MFTSSHQRIPRSNDLKVKHALQICIVLGICIWLIYHVGHSGDDTKTVDEAIKLSRKDLHSHVEESSVIDTRQREEEIEEENRHEEQNKMGDTNGVEDKILMQKRDENDNEENYEHRQDSVDQETEKSSENSTRDNGSGEHNQYSSEENDNMANKENEEKINEVEDKESSQISEEKSQQENEETRDTSMENKENGDINQDRDEMKEHGEVNHEEDSKEDNEERNATENEREENDKIQKVASSEDQAQNGKMNNEVHRDEHYTSTNASNASDNKSQDTLDGGFNKTEQSDKTEKNEFDLKESVSNVTESETTEVANSDVIKTRQGNSGEDQAETPNDSQKSSIADSNGQNNLSGDGVEILHLQNGTDTTSNTTEKQIETPEKSNSKVGDSTSSLNNTMLKAKDSNSDAAWEQASSTLTDSSGTHESNVTNVEYRDTSGNSDQSEIPNNYSIQEGIPEHALSPNTNSNEDASQVVQFASKFENSTSSGQNETVNYVQSNTNSGGSADNNTENNGNENANDSDDVPLNATNSSISEEKDASLKNNVDAGQVENEKTVQNKKSENEEGAQNESMESQKEKEESTHLDGHSKSTLNDQGSSEPPNLQNFT